MSDQRLHELEREAATGDLHAQAKLLQERVRIGHLTDESLRLAAYLGDEAAKVATHGEVAPIPDGPAGVTQRFLAGLERWSLEALARGVLAAAAEVAARTTEASPRVVCPVHGGPPLALAGCDSCHVGPRYAGGAAAEWLRRAGEEGAVHLRTRLWFPEFEGEAVRAAVRASVVPWALARARDPRLDPRVGDIVKGFDKSHREVVHVWPRALAEERPAILKGAETTLPVGTLVISCAAVSDGGLFFSVRVVTPTGQEYYRIPARRGDVLPLVDAPEGTPTVEVQFQPIGDRYSHLAARQTVTLGFWRGFRGKVHRTGPG